MDDSVGAYKAAVLGQSGTQINVYRESIPFSGSRNYNEDLDERAVESPAQSPIQEVNTVERKTTFGRESDFVQV